MTKLVRDDDIGKVWEYETAEGSKITIGHNKKDNFWIVSPLSTTQIRYFKTKQQAMKYLNILLTYYKLRNKIDNYRSTK